MEDVEGDVGVRSRHLCDFCRIRRKKCCRPSSAAKCTECEKSKAQCSPLRTTKEFLDLLYGRNGRLRHRNTSFGTESQAVSDALPDSQLDQSSIEDFLNPPLDWASVSYGDLLQGPLLPSNYETTRETSGVDATAPLEPVQSNSSSIALNWFNEYGSYHVIHIHIMQHLAVLRFQDHYVYSDLSGAATAVERKMLMILGIIEKIGYNADDNHHDDQAQWIYQRLLAALEEWDKIPDDRRRSILLRVARFYQRLNAPVDMWRILEKVAKIRQATLGPSEMDFHNLHIRSIEEASRATKVAFANLQRHEVSPQIYEPQQLDVNYPCPSVHHAIQYCSPALISELLTMARGTPAPSNLIGQTPLHIAAQTGNVGLIDRLPTVYPLLKVDCRDLLKRTPLFIAALNGHDQVCQVLLDKNADINSRDDAGHSVIEVAARHGHLHVVKLLCDRDAEMNPIPARAGSTPLQAAAEAGHISVVRLLLETQKVNVLQQRLFDRKTAEDLACDNGFLDIANLLNTHNKMDFSIG